MLTPLVMAPTSAAPAQTRSLGLMRGNKFALSMSLLGVTANSIVLTPYPAPVGTEVSLSVRLFNSERQAASKVKLEAFIGGDKLGETKIDVPVAKPVLAGGFKTWKATPGRHDVRVVVTWGDRSGSAQKPIEVGSKDAIARLGVASLIPASTGWNVRDAPRSWSGRTIDARGSRPPGGAPTPRAWRADAVHRSLQPSLERRTARGRADSARSRFRNAA